MNKATYRHKFISKSRLYQYLSTPGVNMSFIPYKSGYMIEYSRESLLILIKTFNPQYLWSITKYCLVDQNLYNDIATNHPEYLI